MSGSEQKHGWAWPMRADFQKAHYFINGKSLCGRHNYSGDASPDWFFRGNECKTCRKKLDARLRIEASPPNRINPIAGKWGYTHDGERYHGHYGTAEEAAEAGALEQNECLTVGQYRAPEVLGYIDGQDLIEQILNSEDYSLDCADGSFDCTREQEAELTEAIREAFAKWLDRHDLWPKFGLVEETREIVIKSGDVV